MRRVLVPGLAILFWALPPGRDLTEAYRLASLDDDVKVPTTMERQRWHQDHWAPGNELVIDVADDPDWAVRFDSSEQALSYVAEALTVWTGVAGTDIRWRVGELRDEAASDGRNMVSVGREGTWARMASVNEGRGFEIVECDIFLDVSHVEIRNDYGDADRDDRRDGALIHELGHCLGIDHSAESPIVQDTLPWSRSSVWGEDPRMSYGVHRGEALLPDDRTAALLARPLPGRLEATGSVSGKLTLDGAPAPFVVVDVLRRDGQQVRPAASVFSNEQGQYLAEGLTPGEYFLWIHPLSNVAANDDLAGPAPAGIDDLVALQPIRVRAGEISGGHDFALSRGRAVP